MLGLSPSLTGKDNGYQIAYYWNAFPVVYQRPLTKIIDFRLTTICNIRTNKAGSQIDQLGFEAAFPIFFKAKETRKMSSNGFYLAPVGNFRKKIQNQFDNVGVWLEPGYNYWFDNNFSASGGIQFGGTSFHDDLGQKFWEGYFGFKIIFGIWL